MITKYQFLRHFNNYDVTLYKLFISRKSKTTEDYYMNYKRNFDYFVISHKVERYRQ
jgi:hypothetical protein